MAIAVQFSGHPGSGKTYAIKTFVEKNSDKIVYINADGKPLAWAGWRQYLNKDKKNYFEFDDVDTISKALIGISEKMPQVQCVVIDTINTIMSNKEMRERKKSGYDEIICRSKISLIAGITLESFILQRNHEIWISVNV